MSFVTFDEHFKEDHCYKKDEVPTPVADIEICEDNTVVVSVGDIIHKVAHRNITSNETKIREFCNSCINKKICSNPTKMQPSKPVLVKRFKETPKKKPTPPPIKFAPVFLELCNEHSDMYLLDDEKLVKPGDKFDSHDHFVRYINENAKRWCFYYKCTDSRRPHTENETYTYRCIYLRSKMNKYEKKGLRKRVNPMKTDCPCKIKLRHIHNEKELTAVYVCNHHDHEFSVEQFNKFQHGRRLPPNIREDMMDFMTLEVPRPLIKKYVQMTTGFNMSTGFFYTIEKNLQQKNKTVEIQFTEERLHFLNDQVEALAAMFADSDKMKNEEDQNEEDDDEEFEMSNNGSRHNSKRERKKESKDRHRKSKLITSTPNPIKKKLEAYRELIKSTATLRSGRKIEGSVKCEIQRNPWVSDQCVPVLPKRTGIAKISNELNNDPQEDVEMDQLESNTTHDSQNDTDETNCSNASEIAEEENAEVSNENNIEKLVYETTASEGEYGINIDGQNIIIANGFSNNYAVVNNGLKSYIDSTGTKTDHIEYVTEDNKIDEENVEYLTEDNDMDHDNVELLTENDEVHNSNVEYVAEDNEKYIIEENNGSTSNNSNNVVVQTRKIIRPMLDVHMKDSNMINMKGNNVVNSRRVKNENSVQYTVVNKGIQTSDDEPVSESEESDNEDSEIVEYSRDENGDNYVKYDYVHKYNIDQYMTHPQFPKYIDILAKQTNMNVLEMFTNVYNEKAMFQLITTQKGNEGNTKMRYIYDGKIHKKGYDEAKRVRLGKRLESIIILKEKIRLLKARNKKLLRRNDHLQDFAIRINNMK